jgi:hypothetical protein
MKKLNIFASLLVGVLCFTACEADRDSNPSIDLSHPQAPIHLNTPTFANSTYDFENCDTVTLACTAPSFGFPTTVTYAINLSLDEDMSDPTTLTTTFYKNQMHVKGKELAIATTKQLMTKKGAKREDFPIETAAYIQIHAYINGIENSDSYSNIVKLNMVKTKFALPDVVIPEAFYVNGKFTGNDWEKSVPSAPVNGSAKTHWRICWIDNSGIQISSIKGAPDYAENWIDVTYTSKNSAFTIDEEGVIKTDNAGWYLMIIDGKVDNDKRTMSLTFSFDKPELYLIGTSIVNPDALSSDNTKVPDGIVNKDKAPNDCWNEDNLRNYFTEYVKFEVPTKMDGEFISPKLTSKVKGDGGTRAYVKVRSNDWWKTEFFVFKKGSEERGEIVYRGDGGDQERVDGAVGQRVYFKFSDDTGVLK